MAQDNQIKSGPILGDEINGNTVPIATFANRTTLAGNYLVKSFFDEVSQNSSYTKKRCSQRNSYNPC